MTQNDESGQTTRGERTGIGPGRALHDERLRQEKDTAVVADALHLNRRTIEALEADDSERLPPLTFVRGYIRAYCQFLGMDAEPLIQRLAETEGVAEQQALHPHIGEETRKRHRRRPSSRGAGVVAVALSLALLIGAVAGGAWWLSRAELNLPSLATLTGGETTPAQTGNTDEPASSAASAGSSPEPAPEAESQPEPDVTAEAPPEAERPSQPEPTPEAPEASEAPALDGEAIADAVMGEGTDDDALAANDPADSADPSGASDETAAEAGNGAESAALVMRFSGESWVEVTDAGGERLLFGIAEAGEERLAGEAPFDIVVGDKSNVEIEYEGETVDLADYARGNVARLSVGGSGE